MQLTSMPDVGRCYIVPETMAERRALIGQVSLYPFVW